MGVAPNSFLELFCNKSYIFKHTEPMLTRIFSQKFDSSRRVWLGLNFNPGSGLVWADGARVVAYPASSRLFVWESRRLLSQEVSSADSSRHYGYYIDGDIAKLPGGGRRGAAVLCELIPGNNNDGSKVLALA